MIFNTVHVNGEQAGKWKFYCPEDHEVYTCRDDKKEGPATLFHKNGKVANQYADRNDEHYDDGDVKGFYEDGSPKKSGHFTDGEMNGKFLARYPNGQLRYEENYAVGSREGRFLGFGQSGDTITDDHYQGDVLRAHRKSAQKVAMETQKTIIAKRGKVDEMLSTTRNVLDDVLSREDLISEKAGTSGTLPPATSAYSRIYDKLGGVYN